MGGALFLLHTPGLSGSAAPGHLLGIANGPDDEEDGDAVDQDGGDEEDSAGRKDKSKEDAKESFRKVSDAPDNSGENRAVAERGVLPEAIVVGDFGGVTAGSKLATEVEHERAGEQKGSKAGKAPESGEKRLFDEVEANVIGEKRGEDAEEDKNEGDNANAIEMSGTHPAHNHADDWENGSASKSLHGRHVIGGKNTIGNEGENRIDKEAGRKSAEVGATRGVESDGSSHWDIPYLSGCEGHRVCGDTESNYIIYNLTKKSRAEDALWYRGVTR